MNEPIMCKPSLKFTLAAGITLWLLAACDGESRPFEEAVELGALNIRSLEVIASQSTVEEPILNIGDSLDFDVQGINAVSQTVDLDARDRDWQVSDPAVAQIDQDGRLTALANGNVDVSVRIGGIDSSRYSLRVFNADLVVIESIFGNDTVEPCLPAEYLARGRFDDDSVRDLTGLSWSLAAEDSDNARIVSLSDSQVQLTGLNVAGITLTASGSGLSRSLPITVSDTLRALVITPSTASVGVNETRSFVATGTYEGTSPGSDANNENRTRLLDITNAVTWSIDSGTNQISVSNTDGSRGQVRGNMAGSATLSAACGPFAAIPVSITVSNTVVESLSFRQGTRYALDPDDTDGVVLEVSSGTRYSSANRLDNEDLEWRFSRSGTDNGIELRTEDEDDPGRIIPRGDSGIGTVTVTHPDGATASIIIEIVDS